MRGAATRKKWKPVVSQWSRAWEEGAAIEAKVQPAEGSAAAGRLPLLLSRACLSPAVASQLLNSMLLVVVLLVVEVIVVVVGVLDL